MLSWYGYNERGKAPLSINLSQKVIWSWYKYIRNIEKSIVLELQVDEISLPLAQIEYDERYCYKFINLDFY